ncbi:hypothetical protein [Streptomyces pacificus]|uniref:Uncharacterized protein n=1 Tax=Streptomyces pacificus TaxID=2705029 RepID=A0A6A0AVZ3_9ACTN|nr:hypothetical protein [Streptomyces pacificus]GFH36595.1 hypothetical protein SCWH03_28260 [Streptomyces pacificus]
MTTHTAREIDRDGINRLVAKLGDWIIRHPDGRWTIHHQPPQTTI